MNWLFTVDGEERAQRGGGLAASLQSQCPQHAPGVPCRHRGSPSYPTLLTDSLQACPALPRTALQEAPGSNLSLGHLTQCPWDSGQPNQLIPAGHIPSHKGQADAGRGDEMGVSAGGWRGEGTYVCC